VALKLENPVKTGASGRVKKKMAVLKVLLGSHRHPTAEELFNKVSRSIPGISQTTIYNTLEAFAARGLVRRVRTESDVMRYDAVADHHHHLFSERSDRIEDYFDPELDRLLERYFSEKDIEGFRISRIQLQLVGSFSRMATEKTSNI